MFLLQIPQNLGGVALKLEVMTLLFVSFVVTVTFQIDKHVMIMI